MKIEINKIEAKHILNYDIDCGSCHAHKFSERGVSLSKRPRFNCKYNKKFRSILEQLERGELLKGGAK